MMDEEVEAPENDEDFNDPNPLDELETELPESEEVPPSEIQDRLEQPLSVHWTEDEIGTNVAVERDAVTQPGVAMTWTEPDPLLLEEASAEEKIDKGIQSSTGGTP